MKIFEVLSTLFSIELENHPASKKVSLFFVIVSLMTLRGKMNNFASFVISLYTFCKPNDLMEK